MKSIIVRHIFSLGFSFLLTYYLIPIIARAAKRLGILDVPDGKIKCHKEPTPYLGGVAVFIPFIATLALAYPFENTLLWLLLGATLLVLTGLIDDLHVLKPGQKLVGQFIAVLCFLKGGFSLKTAFLSSSVNLFLSGFWMLSVINAFNLVDVMDGLSTLIAIIATAALFLIALFFKQYAISLLLLAFLGPALAFFWYNKPPAKIYLGDTGSMFFGGFLAAVPLLFPWSKQALDAYYAPVIILAVPLLEVFFLIVIRTSLGIPFYKGSHHHFSIYLQRKGWSKWAVLFYASIMGVSFSSLGILYLVRVVDFCLMLFLASALIFAWCFFVFSSFCMMHTRTHEHKHRELTNH